MGAVTTSGEALHPSSGVCRRVEAVCFDLGGVLVRICGSWREAAAAAGVGWPADGPEHLTSIACFNQFQAGTLSVEAYSEEFARLHGLSPEQALEVHNAILLEPYPATDRLVEQLVARGIRCGCLSNTNEPHWKTMLHSGRLPVIEMLEIKAASHEFKLEKPDPRFYKEFERMSGVSGEAIVYFDDTPANVDASLELGWNGYLIDPKGDPAAQMAAVLACHGVPIKLG